jgi:hypothetical protein
MLGYQPQQQNARIGFRRSGGRQQPEVEVECQDETAFLDGPPNVFAVGRSGARLACRQDIMAGDAKCANRLERDVLVGKKPHHAAPGRTLKSVWSCSDSAA